MINVVKMKLTCQEADLMYFSRPKTWKMIYDLMEWDLESSEPKRTKTYSCGPARFQTIGHSAYGGHDNIDVCEHFLWIESQVDN